MSLASLMPDTQSIVLSRIFFSVRTSSSFSTQSAGRHVHIRNECTPD